MYLSVAAHAMVHRNVQTTQKNVYTKYEIPVMNDI